MGDTSPQRYLTVQEAAAKLGLTVQGVYKRIARNQVPYRKMGGRVRIPEKDLDEFMAGLPGCSVDRARDMLEEDLESILKYYGRRTKRSTP